MGARNIYRLLESPGAGFTVTAHTANKSLAVGELNEIHTTRGAAGAVTFTLPGASGNSGQWCLFISAADFTMSVTGTDEELLTFNDLTADTVAFDQSGKKIGQVMLAICDGSSWCVSPIGVTATAMTVTSG